MTVPITVIAVVGMPVAVTISVAGPLRHAEHTLDAACDTTGHSPDRTADNPSDRPGSPAAGGRALGRATSDALGLSRKRQGQQAQDGGHLQQSCRHGNASSEMISG
jgi:hypothetical protein